MPCLPCGALTLSYWHAASLQVVTGRWPRGYAACKVASEFWRQQGCARHATHSGRSGHLLHPTDRQAHLRVSVEDGERAVWPAVPSALRRSTVPCSFQVCTSSLGSRHSMAPTCSVRATPAAAPALQRALPRLQRSPCPLATRPGSAGSNASSVAARATPSSGGSSAPVAAAAAPAAPAATEALPGEECLLMLLMLGKLGGIDP